MSEREAFEAWFSKEVGFTENNRREAEICEKSWQAALAQANVNEQSQAQQPSCTYTWNCPRCGSGKCIDESDASQAQQPEYTFDQLTKMMMQAATKEGHKVTMKIKWALPPAPDGGE